MMIDVMLCFVVLCRESTEQTFRAIGSSGGAKLEIFPPADGSEPAAASTLLRRFQIQDELQTCQSFYLNDVHFN